MMLKTIDGQEKAESCKLTIPLHDKIFVTEAYQDQGHNLIAVGLRSSLVVIQLVLDEESTETTIPGYQVLLRLDHDSRVHCIAWSPETTLNNAPKCVRFATGGSDYNVRIYSSDLGTDDTMKVLKGHSDYVNAIAFQPDSGAQLVSGSDDHTVALWDAMTGRKIETMTFNSPIMALSWHPDEVSKLMVAEKSGVLHIINVVSYHVS